MDKYLELKEQFEANRDDENAAKMAAYMRNLFPFYGLPTPKRKAIYKEFLKAEKSKKVLKPTWTYSKYRDRLYCFPQVLCRRWHWRAAWWYRRRYLIWPDWRQSRRYYRYAFRIERLYYNRWFQKRPTEGNSRNIW